MSLNNQSVLIVDDEQAIRRFLRVALTTEGYSVIEAANGQTAVSIVASEKPDVVVLDLGLPDLDGVEVTRLLRKSSRVPIIILSVRGSEKDKIEALDSGADDYLTKPFSTGELLARLRASLRRVNQRSDEPIFEAGDLLVDLNRRLVTLSGKEVQLTPNEFNLLQVLVAHAGMVLTHHQLLKEVWGPAYEAELHMLHVNISNLRRKIEPYPARPIHIITEAGVGYRLRNE
jgi:two-component system KDP operon response regulator KdpE